MSNTTQKTDTPINTWLVDLIDEFLTINAMENDGCVFGWYIMRDRSLVTRLRDGGDVTTRKLETILRAELQQLWQLPNVGDIRQVGLVAGIELVKDWRTRKPFDLRERAGIRVCEAMTRRGVLTRPVGNVIVLMPPYCTTPAQLPKMISALREAVETCFR